MLTRFSHNIVFASVVLLLLLACLICAFQVFFFILDQVFVAWVHWYDTQSIDKVIGTVACLSASPFSLLMGMTGKEVVDLFTAES